MDSYLQQQQQQMGEAKKTGRELNPEEVRYLFTKLSSDETKELRELMSKCTTEVTVTRAVPTTAAILGSLYFIRQRVPVQYHFGPKGWPYYAIVGFASLVVTNMFFLRTCRERMLPKIDQYWQKYQEIDSHKMTYDHIRQQHRAGVPVSEAQYGQSNETTYDTLRQEHRGREVDPRPSTSGTFIYNMPQDRPFSSYGQPDEKDVITPPRRTYTYQPYPEESSFMSGTPSGPSFK